MRRRYEPSCVAELAAHLARHVPSLSTYSAAALATELCAIARAQHRHAERACSESWYDGAKQARAVASIARRIAAWRGHFVEWYGAGDVDIRLADDPRGCCVFLRLGAAQVADRTDDGFRVVP